MPFGIVRGFGRGIRILDEDGNRRGRSSFGVNLGRPIVTNWYCVAKLYESDVLFPSYFGEDLLNKFNINHSGQNR